MRNKPIVLPLALALAALSSERAVASLTTAQRADEKGGKGQNAPLVDVSDANVFVSVGNDLLSFLITENADGTIVAQHRSHSSHSSHSSHRSHSSSRY